MDHMVLALSAPSANRGSGPFHVNPWQASSVISWRTEGSLLIEADIREFLLTGYPRLVAGLTLMAGSRAAAEDAVQEAVARAWERSQRGEPIDSLPAWVTRVAVNLSRSRWRRSRVEQRGRERIGGAGGPAHRDDRPEDRIDVRRALAALPRRQREATVLRYYLGLDVAEVAAALGVTEGTAKTTLYRARQTLAAALGDHDEQAQDHVPLR
jgi:RNA polymerase sigma-70 factor (ECF subfamily)